MSDLNIKKNRDIVNARVLADLKKGKEKRGEARAFPTREESSQGKSGGIPLPAKPGPQKVAYTHWFPVANKQHKDGTNANLDLFRQLGMLLEGGGEYYKRKDEV